MTQKEISKKIRETFQFILDGKLEKIAIEKEKKLKKIKSLYKTRKETKEAKRNLDLHEYTLPFLEMMFIVKKEKYISKNILNKYNEKYHKILVY